MPIIGPKIGMVSPIMAMAGGVANIYKHVGMQLQMKGSEFENGKIYRLSFPQDDTTDESYAKEITELLEDGKNFITSITKVFKNESKIVAGYHSCEEYERRLNVIKSDLSSKTLNSVYTDKTVVGKVLDAGYEPAAMKTKKERFDRITGSKVLKDTIMGRA